MPANAIEIRLFAPLLSHPMPDKTRSTRTMFCDFATTQQTKQNKKNCRMNIEKNLKTLNEKLGNSTSATIKRPKSFLFLQKYNYFSSPFFWMITVVVHVAR